MNNNHAHMNGNSTAHVKVRPASHAGSWYSDAPGELDQQLSGWLRDAGSNIGSARAIISPKRIFVLGPSHVVYLSGCALTTFSKYATPLGDLNVDSFGQDYFIFFRK
uniref:Uncharacterized protein n=1 Tax=Meloidogyne javanica TaxID=6303 RepID=A0A915LV19_MELJA